ncbi:MAG: SIMPL domain-containing protein [Cyanobacteriota bacterium]|nr:SIMPL domain-containing protein [Cyanobacteriota bacterium]
MACRSTVPGLLVGVLAAAPLALAAAPAEAEGQIQLRCDGTLLAARGSAERKRSTERLRVSLGLEAEAGSADGVLGLLQERLAAVRQQLLQLGVQELEVGSPSTWQTSGPRLPAQVSASLQLTGLVSPRSLQALVRGVGSLPGVRLAPVSAAADPAGDAASRRSLLRAAYQDALQQGLDLAGAMGLEGTLKPMEVLPEGGPRPGQRRVMAAEAAPFDPDELAAPVDRLSLQVRFCAH